MRDVIGWLKRASLELAWVPPKGAISGAIAGGKTAPAAEVTPRQITMSVSKVGRCAQWASDLVNRLESITMRILEQGPEIGESVQSQCPDEPDLR